MELAHLLIIICGVPNRARMLMMPNPLFHIKMFSMNTSTRARTMPISLY